MYLFYVFLQQVERVGVDFTLAVIIWTLIFLLTLLIGYIFATTYRADN